LLPSLCKGCHLLLEIFLDIPVLLLLPFFHLTNPFKVHLLFDLLGINPAAFGQDVLSFFGVLLHLQVELLELALQLGELSAVFNECFCD